MGVHLCFWPTLASKMGFHFIKYVLYSTDSKKWEPIFEPSVGQKHERTPIFANSHFWTKKCKSEGLANYSFAQVYRDAKDNKCVFEFNKTFSFSTYINKFSKKLLAKHCSFWQIYRTHQRFPFLIKKCGSAPLRGFHFIEFPFLWIGTVQ